jgi:AraC-like DNA-binding protein
MPGPYNEIDVAISYIHNHLYEPLSLSHIASYVGYSSYHFSRLFKEKTGLPPLYYVSSLRLQKAKELLLNTNLTVRDIGLEIGQQSLGTFTTRFTKCVGMSPSHFRESMNQVNHSLHSLQMLSDWHSSLQSIRPFSTVTGTIDSEAPLEGFILIGLFSKPIPEGLPLYGNILLSTGSFSFTGVKPGIYYLMATSISWSMQAKDILLPYTTLRGRIKEPIIVTESPSILEYSLTLHTPRLDDPPILISLPLLMKNFLKARIAT